VKTFKALGDDLEPVPRDDQAKPEVGVANARNMVADPDVLVIVGHFNSGVALPSSEVYKDAMLSDPRFRAGRLKSLQGQL
jgi:branched-chain amino acid transport system substrate-binding protein